MSLRTVLTCVGVACMGALAFGYHLAVVNGPLTQIAFDLGFAGNKSMEGLVSVVVLSKIGVSVVPLPSRQVQLRFAQPGCDFRE